MAPFARFKESIVQAIQNVFKTEVVGLGGKYVNLDPLVLFVDRAGNRWTLEVKGSVSKLYAYFQRLRTRCTTSTLEWRI